MVQFPVFQYIACLVAAMLILIFFVQIRKYSVRLFFYAISVFKSVRSYFRVKYKKHRRKTRSYKIKHLISQFFFNRELWGVVYITKIQVRKKVVTIHSARPGIVIGKQGSTIEALKNFLKEKHGIERISLKESNPYN